MSMRIVSESFGVAGKVVECEKLCRVARFLARTRVISAFEGYSSNCKIGCFVSTIYTTKSRDPKVLHAWAGSTGIVVARIKISAKSIGLN